MTRRWPAFRGVSGEARDLGGEVGNLSLVLPDGARVRSPGVEVSADGGFGTSVDRFKVVAGRMFRPGRADEVVIDPQLAVYGLRPGSTVRLVMAPAGARGTPVYRRAVRLRLRVAGVVVFGNQIVPVSPATIPGAGAVTGVLPQPPGQAVSGRRR